jgi:hypothetical protein
MPRRVPVILTLNDIQRICREATPASYARSGVISDLRPPFTKKLRGQSVLFYFDDGTVLGYRFGCAGLEWNENGGEWHEEASECLESSADGVFLIHHLRTHINPCEAATIIWDANSAEATWVRDRFGNKNANRDVSRTIVFGASDASATGRHAKTDEMVGKVIDWKLADGVKIHTIYETVVCCALVSPPPAGAPDWADFFETFNPSRYIKIRDGLFLISFYAPNQSGMEVTMLMDLQKMRALGAAFGIDMTETLRSYTFGAKGAYAPIGFIGRYTVE